MSLLRLALSITLGALLSGSACKAPLDRPMQVVAAAEDIQIEGRLLHGQDGLILGFPGTQVTFAPKSSAFSLHLNSEKDGVTIEVSRDGRPFQKQVLRAGSQTIDYLPYKRPKADGVVIVNRSTENWQGLMTIERIDTDFGFRDLPKQPKTKLLFIGDSITAGSGTESRLNEAGEREAVSNARVAYPRVLGNRLNAQVHHVAYGGRGVTRDWQGIIGTNNAPQFYDRVLPDDPTYKWDPTDYQADIVSIMLGTNDFNPGIPDRESWTAAYRKFVSRVRRDYPKAQVFLISSPMTDGEKGDVLKKYVRSVAESFETPRVSYIEVDKYHGEPWDSHPTAAEHQRIADELEPSFRASLDE